MGFLNIFKPKAQNKDDVYFNLTIKRILEDVEYLKQQVNESNIKINDLKRLINKKRTKQKIKLSPLEQRIFNYYNNMKVKSFNTLSKELKIHKPSLKVYISKINKKQNIKLIFE